MLRLRVSNTIDRHEPAGREGIGLKNVRERLAIQFGERAKFEASARAGGQWVAEIRLPRLGEVSDVALTASVAA